uniref:Uncharacterized protein n=1 Tax=Rhizophora mucronata TaxID=61149 RepID=A0A2P2QFR8_RHIMU
MYPSSLVCTYQNYIMYPTSKICRCI